MPRLPEQFREEYEARGEGFFAVARLLVENHDRRYTLGELAETVDRSKSRVSDYTTTLAADGWLDRREGQTTFGWNTGAYDPTERAARPAVFGFYRDLWQVFRTHVRTGTGAYAVFGFVLLLTAAVMWVFYASFQLGVADSALPVGVYLGLGAGLALAGLVATAVAPLQALVNRRLEALSWRLRRWRS